MMASLVGCLASLGAGVDIAPVTVGHFKVRLVFVSEGDIPPKTAWRGDGSPASFADVVRLVRGSRSHTGPSSRRTINLYFEVSGWDRSTKLIAYGLNGMMGGTAPGSRVLDRATGKTRIVPTGLLGLMYQVPPRQETMDVRFGLASGPFHKIVKGAPGIGLFRGTTIEREVNRSGVIGERAWFKRNGEHGREVIRGNPPDRCTVSVLIPAAAAGEDVELSALDRAGKPLRSLGDRPDPRAPNQPPGRVRSFMFSVDKGKDIGTLELNGRNIHWVTFKNIRLHPR